MLNAYSLRPKEFSVLSLSEIYTVGLVMGVAGYPVSPEASREHMLLMGNHTKNDTIVMNSTFIHKSQVVSKAKTQACTKKGITRLRWSMDAYTLHPNWNSYVETRTSLALAGGKVDCRTGTPVITVPVNYPPKATATFVSIGGVKVLSVQEGLFNVLEERRWYTPYTAMYL